MKFIKKHLHVIVGVIIIIFVAILAIMIKNFFFPNDNEVYYGNRLEGIEKVKITDKQKNAIKDSIKDSTKSTTVRVAGRIIYIDVVTNDDISVDTARDFGFNVLDALSDEEKAYYDVQLLIDNDTNKDQFPIIGYKHHTKEYMSWTKTR